MCCKQRVCLLRDLERWIPEDGKAFGEGGTVALWGKCEGGVVGRSVELSSAGGAIQYRSEIIFLEGIALARAVLNHSCFAWWNWRKDREYAYVAQRVTHIRLCGCSAAVQQQLRDQLVQYHIIYLFELGYIACIRVRYVSEFK